MVWKVYATVVNFRLKRCVTLHNALHGFRSWRVMGTTTLEAKLAHQLAEIAYEPLFQVVLDIQKVYDLLDRGQCMEILHVYVMG